MFSGAALLADLDDFIAPSQSCVNPLFTDAAAAPRAGVGGGAAAAPRGGAKLELASDFLLPAAAAAAAPPAARPDLIRPSPGGGGGGAPATATVSLSDCLACSGCVTSAETVLIQQQSAGEMLRALADPANEVCVASLSPQALSSLAAHFGEPSALAAYRRAAAYLRALGFTYVVDTQPAAELALAEACAEFVARARARPRTPEAAGGGGDAQRPWAAPPPSIAASATRVQTVTAFSSGGVATAAGAPELVPDARAAAAAVAAAGQSPPGHAAAEAAAPHADAPPRHSPPLPLLASACPGWVCYAEKTVPEALAHVSAVRSPQQLTGALVKHVLTGGALLPAALRALSGGAWEEEGRAAEAAAPSPLCSGDGRDAAAAAVVSSAARPPAAAAALRFRPSRDGRRPAGGAVPRAASIYHVAVMPCFDKKLEASRKDFAWDGGGGGGAGGEGEGAVREVDCVVTPGELAELMAATGVEWSALVPEPRRGYYGRPGADTDTDDDDDDEGAREGGGGGGRDGAAGTPLTNTDAGRQQHGDEPPQRASAPLGGTGQPAAAAARGQHRQAVWDVERLFTGVTRDGAELVGPPAGQVSSDAYAETVFRHAAAVLHGVTLPASQPIAWVPGRNPDFHEASLLDPAGSGRVLLRFALAYGFRNIQTVVTRLKRGRAPVRSGGGALGQRGERHARRSPATDCHDALPLRASQPPPCPPTSTAVGLRGDHGVPQRVRQWRWADQARRGGGGACGGGGAPGSSTRRLSRGRGRCGTGGSQEAQPAHRGVRGGARARRHRGAPARGAHARGCGARARPRRP